MKNKLSFIYALALLLSSFVHGNTLNTKPIKVLYTAAIIPRDYENRKNCYIRNLQMLKQYGCDVYVVESCQSGPTFLDDFCDHVCYTKSNDPSALPSYNETTSVKIGLEHFNFDHDEMIIKVTGRYVLETDEFISLVNANLDADLIARKWEDFQAGGGKQHDAYTGCFAIKVKYLHDIINNYYFKHAFESYHIGSEVHLYAIEWALGDYIEDNKYLKKIIYIEKLYDYLPEALTRK